MSIEIESAEYVLYYIFILTTTLAIFTIYF